MKKRMMILVLLFLTTAAMAGEPSTVEPPRRCQRCQMDRTMFDYSRMLIAYTDGTTVGVCSLNCAVQDALKNPEKKIASLKVADFTTKVLTDAKAATWVVGGSKKGVMTFVPKWAFARKQDAKKFIEENGGDLATFRQVWTMAETEQSGR